MYNWGYIKNAVLAKLDLTLEEALENKLVNRFVFYANEAMTQISSTIKPDKRIYEVKTYKSVFAYSEGLCIDDVHVPNVHLEGDFIFDNDKNLLYCPVNKTLVMPKDFISFSNDVCYIQYSIYNAIFKEECHDTDIEYVGHNKFICKNVGTYYIPYNARWCDFSEIGDDTDITFIPVDILECLPSYIAHQCSKVDDEQRAAIFRNEYEIFLSRIDDTNFNNTKTILIGGDW